jgi:hypothetical protein
MVCWLATAIATLSHGGHREVILKAPSTGESDFLQTQLAVIQDNIDTKLA